VFSKIGVFNIEGPQQKNKENTQEKQIQMKQFLEFQNQTNLLRQHG
jgi:hypothetical protein